jgi:hypothetical protein
VRSHSSNDAGCLQKKQTDEISASRDAQSSLLARPLVR